MGVYMNIFTSTVPGKLLLFGEHVVLSGAPGIAVTLPLSLDAELQIGNEITKGLEIITDNEYTDTVKNIAERQWHLLAPHTKPSGHLTITSSIPPGQGFGSSAALCASLALITAHTVLQASGRGNKPSCCSGTHHIDAAQLDDERRLLVWKLAHEGEKLVHGTPSGIDTGAVLHKGLNAFYDFNNALPALVPCKLLGGWLVWGYIPRALPARVCIEKVAQARASSAYRELMHIAQQSFELVTSPYRNADVIETIGSFAERATHCFEDLDLNPRKMADLSALAKQEGALGGKLSGAGMGGAFWFVLRTKDDAQRLKQRILTEKICCYAAIAEI